MLCRSQEKLTRAERGKDPKAEMRFLESFLYGNSALRIQANVPACQMNFPSEPTKREKTIRDLLLAPNPQPIAILYDYSALLFEGKSARSFDTQYPSHVSLLIGERTNSQGRCQFLIRNSYGPQCLPQYSTDWDCEKNTGEVWVDADYVSRATAGLEYLR